MSKELGIGVRVHVGWVPLSNTELKRGHDPRLTTGTVIEGPFAPWTVGWCRTMNQHFQNNSPYTQWNVDCDIGGSVLCSEFLLTPIDDDDDASEREAEKPRETDVVV